MGSVRGAAAARRWTPKTWTSVAEVLCSSGFGGWMFRTTNRIKNAIHKINGRRTWKGRRVFSTLSVVGGKR